MTDPCIHPDPRTCASIYCRKCGAFKLLGGELQFLDEHGRPKRKPYHAPVLRELGSVNKMTLGSVPPTMRRKAMG